MRTLKRAAAELKAPINYKLRVIVTIAQYNDLKAEAEQRGLTVSTVARLRMFDGRAIDKAQKEKET